MTASPNRFLSLASAILLLGACVPGAETAADASAGELSARVPPAPAAGPGTTGLRRLREAGALLYVPTSYRPGQAMPLLVMLHGAGGDARHSMLLTGDHAERLGFLVLAPKSRAATWDVVSGRRYGPDVSALDSALREVFEAYGVDPRRIAVAGFSDGATYALALGRANGKLFSRIFAFSPGFLAPARKQGKPRIFVSHGKSDRVLPIDDTGRRVVHDLTEAGYRVTYEEFAGGHEVPERIARRFFETLVEASPSSRRKPGPRGGKARRVSPRSRLSPG
jgi:predicted esterase